MTEYEWNHQKWGIAYGTIIVVASVVLFLRAAFGPLPVVQMTWPGETCVAVVPEDSGYSCSNLPKRYEVEWVAPRMD